MQSGDAEGEFNMWSFLAASKTRRVTERSLPGAQYLLTERHGKTAKRAAK